VDLFRVFPSLLDVPSMGNTLPRNLAQFAAVFGQQPVESFSVDKIAVGRPGMSAYAPECGVELVRPVL
jgi:hypothetical protein